MILVRLNFIAVTATIVLVGAIAWHLSATVTKHSMIEQRKMEVMEWAARQDDLNELLKTKYGVMLSINTAIPGSFRLLNVTVGHELSAQDVEAIRTDLYRRKCPYGITLIDGLR